MAEPLKSSVAGNGSKGANAIVTLLTAPSYLPGALTLLHALQELHPSPRDFKTVCLVTPETVDASTIGSLRNAGYDLVIGVEPIASGTAGQAGLRLMGRPDLNLALTKLHIFRLGEMFETILYMDADTLPIRPVSHLFKLTAPHIISACSDIGWPDCFNSGVMVIRPRLSDFDNLRRLMAGESDQGNGSFDGADQGLLNQYFNDDGGAGGPWNRLPFTYNVTPSAAYQYLPAFTRYAHKISVIHFIGPHKPWKRLSYRPAGLGVSQDSASSMSYEHLIDRWFDVYDRNVRPTAIHDPNLAKRFTVPENIAVWNHPRDIDQFADQTVTDPSHPTTTMGQYTSLPLDGRLDLMMPQPVPQSREETEQDELDRRQSGSSPHTTEPAAISHREHVQQPQPSPPLHSEAPHHVIWDASRHPPPADSRPEMAVSVNQVYAPAWDEPTSTQSAYFHELREDDSMPSLPSNVLRNDWYGEFTGTVPDPDKGGKVFPWEKATEDRAQPSRVFPRQSQRQEEGVTSHPAPSTTETASKSPGVAPDVRPVAAAKPASSFSSSMAEYTNAWDSDASIGRYAKRLTELGIVTSRRVASGMQTVPPSPRRAAHGPSSQSASRTQRGGDRTHAGETAQRSSQYARSSYHDKCTQTERPPQSDAFVQASPETSPVSESPPKLRTFGSPTVSTPITTYSRRGVGTLPAASPKQQGTSTAPMPRQAKITKRSGGRVWDPRTDIDVMRRDGQQAFARFTTGS